MAIYRTGQASMDADGYITGYGTKWKTALTLIRPGATIVFASNPVAYATISEIVNDTSLRATSTGGSVVPRGDYVILLHDSITVDGLAQDVAETLRYYQGQETMYQEFVEFLKGFDWQRMEQLGEKAYADAKAAEASANAAKESETNANASKNAAAGSATTASQKATEAANSAGAAKTSETNANASKTAAANSSTAAANYATTAGQHKDAAAASASAARTSESNASASKTAAASSASAAKTSETNAKSSETNAASSASAANTAKNEAQTAASSANASKSAAANSATAASGSATTAKNEADRAAELAKQFDATNLMRKDANLSDVVNKSAARANLGVPGMTEVGLTPTGDINQKNANDIRYNGFFAGAGVDGVNFIDKYSPGLVMRRINSVFQMQGDVRNGGNIWIRSSLDGGDFSQWKRAMIEGDFGFATNGTFKPTSWINMPISEPDGATNWAPSNGGGFQTCYAGSRAAQIWVDNSGRLWSRFNMSSSPQATNSESPWKRAIFDGDPGFVSGPILIKADGECYRIKGVTENATLYMIARNSDNSPNWYVGKGSRDNDKVALHSYKYNTTLELRADDVAVNKELTVSGNIGSLGSTVYVDGGEGSSITRFWLRNRYKRSRATIHADDNQVLIIRSDNGATGATGQEMTINGATGECRAVTFTSTSDERAKFWIKPVTGALDKICSLRGVTYSMHTTLERTVRNAGVIAQDVQKVLPEAVTVNKTGSTLDKNCFQVENPLSLDYNALSALYVEAFKEMRGLIESQRAEIEALKAEIMEIKNNSVVLS